MQKHFALPKRPCVHTSSPDSPVPEQKTSGRIFLCRIQANCEISRIHTSNHTVFDRFSFGLKHVAIFSVERDLKNIHGEINIIVDQHWSLFTSSRQGHRRWISERVRKRLHLFSPFGMSLLYKSKASWATHNTTQKALVWEGLSEGFLTPWLGYQSFWRPLRLCIDLTWGVSSAQSDQSAQETDTSTVNVCFSIVKQTGPICLQIATWRMWTRAKKALDARTQKHGVIFGNPFQITHWDLGMFLNLTPCDLEIYSAHDSGFAAMTISWLLNPEKFGQQRCLEIPWKVKTKKKKKKCIGWKFWCLEELTSHSVTVFNLAGSIHLTGQHVNQVCLCQLALLYHVMASCHSAHLHASHLKKSNHTPSGKNTADTSPFKTI